MACQLFRGRAANPSCQTSSGYQHASLAWCWHSRDCSRTSR